MLLVTAALTRDERLTFGLPWAVLHLLLLHMTLPRSTAEPAGALLEGAGIPALRLLTSMGKQPAAVANIKVLFDSASAVASAPL